MASGMLDDLGYLDDERGLRRHWIWLLLFGLLLLALLVVGSMFARYLERPAPLPEMLPLPLEIAYRPHYLFSIYGVDQPVGVALSPAGDRVYVSESGGQRMVKVLDRDGDLLAELAPPSSGPGQRAPVYLAVDATGRVLVTDRLRGAILVYDGDGSYLGAVGQAESWAPLGIRIDASGSVLLTSVAGSSHHVLQMPEALLLGEGPAAESELRRIGPGVEGMAFPNVAVADSQGRVYVTDGNNGRISVWGRHGELLATLGLSSADGMLNLPHGAAIDGQDRLHVVDTIGQDVKVYDVSGEEPAFLFAFGDWGSGQGQFNYPGDIAIDASGRLYITDRENQRVQVWSY